MSGSLSSSFGLSSRLRFWEAPLVPVALSFTAGVALDWYLSISFSLFLALAAVLLLLWFRRPRQGLLFLWLAVFLLGGGYHHYRVRLAPADSLGRLQDLDEKPVRLQGRVVSDGQRRLPPSPSPLRTFPPAGKTTFVMNCQHVVHSGVGVEASGSVQVWLEGEGEAPTWGERVDVIGILHFPGPPANPGGADRVAQLRDRGIVATLDADLAGCRVLEPATLAAQAFIFVSWLRHQSKQLLERYIPPEQYQIAAALLLGNSAAMTGDDWDIYVRSGVVHVLAISGQHLAILAAFLFFFARLGHVSRRRAAPGIVFFLLGYALLAGGRPPVMRAVWMVSAFAAASWIRRPVPAANSFALAWLLVGLWQPNDLFQIGCLLSFLAVGVLTWGTEPLPKDDPIADLQAEQRPLWLTMLHNFLCWIGRIYLVNALVWIALIPFIASRLNLVSPVALLIGPPMMLGTSLALLSGFLLLLLGAFLPQAGIFFGWLTSWLLSWCQELVHLTLDWPFAYEFVADVNLAWVIAFYVALVLYLTFSLVRQHPRLFWVSCVLWLGVGWLGQIWPRPAGEFRCTFLAVGHGGCIVLEAPDGGVFLYDAGAMAGPEVTRQHIAPFLWQRGIRRIDELFLSHADLDHFNGVPSLTERFSIGRVNLTPSFAGRSSLGVQLTMEEIGKRNLPTHILSRGECWRQGGIDFEVLHPPSTGPEGNENARSLVLLITHRDLSILLTGDLEEAGLEQVLQLPPRQASVLMAPHHGSRRSNIPELAKWAMPKFVVSCQGRPRTAHPAYPGARYLSTWDHGAVTIRSDKGRKSAETFRTGKVWKIE